MSATPAQQFFNVAILGATGPGLGNALVEAFLNNKVYKTNVRFLYREESGKDATKRANIDALQAKGAIGYSVDEKSVDSIASALQGVDVVVSALGTPAVFSGTEKLFIDAAAKAGAKRFVNSAWGVDMPPINQNFKVKGEAPLYIAEKGLQWTTFACGTWLEYFASSFFGFDLEKFTALVPEDGKFYFSISSFKDVATVASYAIHHPSSKNTTVTVSANSLSWNEYLSIYERAFGRKFQTSQKSVAQLREYSAGLPQEQFFDKIGLDLLAYYSESSVADYRETAFNRVYAEYLPGVKFLTVEEFAHLQASSKH